MKRMQKVAISHIRSALTKDIWQPTASSQIFLYLVFKAATQTLHQKTDNHWSLLMSLLTASNPRVVIETSWARVFSEEPISNVYLMVQLFLSFRKHLNSIFLTWFPAAGDLSVSNGNRITASTTVISVRWCVESIFIKTILIIIICEKGAEEWVAEGAIVVGRIRRKQGRKQQQFIHSFILNIYIPPLQENYSTAKKSSLKVRKNSGEMVLLKIWSSEG